MTTWFAVGAGAVMIWVGLGLFCAQAMMTKRSKPRREAAGSPALRPSHTPVPRATAAE